MLINVRTQMKLTDNTEFSLAVNDWSVWYENMSWWFSLFVCLIRFFTSQSTFYALLRLPGWIETRYL